jgi:hypothetical protein
MEKVVYRDDLWSNLQMTLWITQRSDSSTSDKFRVFECCCNVLDVAFSVLDNSPKVDWRAPEFGSLWERFESFITHDFQGAFMGRAASFRIGIIKARFCQVLLAQFWDDAFGKEVLPFPSQWDVASLTKIFRYLALQREDDSKFWNSYFNGGHIGEEFTDKAMEMIDIITSNGPLSIFCRLGYLATSTILSRHSGLERNDVVKVLELQDKLMMDQRPPLNRASGTVWNDLDRLREQVEGLCGVTSGGTDDIGNAGEKRELLQRLLWKIDDVRNLRDTRSEGPSHSGHAEERPSAVPWGVEVNGGSPTSAQATETSEGEHGFEGATYLLIPRASINLQPELDSLSLSSSQNAVQRAPSMLGPLIQVPFSSLGDRLVQDLPLPGRTLNL